MIVKEEGDSMTDRKLDLYLENFYKDGYMEEDCIGRVMKEEIEEMTKEEYDMYIRYHLSICEREDLMGYSGHILSIMEK